VLQYQRPEGKPGIVGAPGKGLTIRPPRGPRNKGHGHTYAKRVAVLAAYAAANTDTFLGERFRRLAPARRRRPGESHRHRRPRDPGHHLTC
jgi:hypothetical protein